jgi:hypothetical protein
MTHAPTLSPAPAAAFLGRPCKGKSFQQFHGLVERNIAFSVRIQNASRLQSIAEFGDFRLVI